MTDVNELLAGAKQAHMTAWQNPTKDTVRFRIRRTHGDGRRKGQVDDHTCAPGGIIFVHSDYDRAIQRVENGQIVAGLAPQLVKVGSEPIPLHPALDTQEAARREAERAAIEAYKQRTAADAAAVAAGEKAAAAKAKAEANVKAQQDAKAKAEAEARAKAEADAEAKQREQDARAKAEADKSKRGGGK